MNEKADYKPSASLLIRHRIYSIIAYVSLVTFPLASLVNKGMVAEKIAIIIWGGASLLITIIVTLRYDSSQIYNISISCTGVRLKYSEGIFLKNQKDRFITWDEVEKIYGMKVPNVGAICIIFFQASSYIIHFKLFTGENISIESWGDSELKTIAVNLQSELETAHDDRKAGSTV